MSILFHSIYMDAKDWRDDGQRYLCFYEVEVTGLSGKDVPEPTVIMVPIPATKEGRFFTPPAQKDPYFTQELMHEINNWPEKHRRGPYFENATEIFNNKTIPGGWTTFIAETEKGPMLGFRTNESRLQDISFSADFVADYYDIFDPINNESPILFPVENVSNSLVVPYGEYTKYASIPIYESYVYVSDYRQGAPIHFHIHLDAHNDPNEWPRKYRGQYLSEIKATVSRTGFLKVRVILGQEIPWMNSSQWNNRYSPEYYADETS
ncbi:hypothetical protein [Methanosarcina sp. MSH10X1]|uniref:hypothetical protein n=1 Tax=Methanosarcina sp. MSH10X1 TaxID=2507075 RepID=UPI001F0BB9BD|nr:hypothetical protein [Methanosarcina sp. MSH10X1]